LFKKIHILRVKPKQELLNSIATYCNEHKITSAIVIGIIGSVEKARLNFLVKLPGKYETIEYTGPLEIVCAQGSVATKENNPVIHVHIVLSKQEFTCGGHLAEAIIFSTAEVVIGEIDYQLRRELDKYTGLYELAI